MQTRGWIHLPVDSEFYVYFHERYPLFFQSSRDRRFFSHFASPCFLALVNAEQRPRINRLPSTSPYRRVMDGFICSWQNPSASRQQLLQGAEKFAEGATASHRRPPRNMNFYFLAGRGQFNSAAYIPEKNRCWWESRRFRQHSLTVKYLWSFLILITAWCVETCITNRRYIFVYSQEYLPGFFSTYTWIHSEQ